MEEISKISKILLKEIINNDGNVEYFTKYFNSNSTLKNSKYKNEETLRSAFGELKDAGLINLFWADNIPWTLSITSKGKTYLKEKRDKKILSFLKWLIGTIIALAAIILPILLEK